jgi:hypothetical protein
MVVHSFLFSVRAEAVGGVDSTMILGCEQETQGKPRADRDRIERGVPLLRGRSFGLSKIGRSRYLYGSKTTQPMLSRPLIWRLNAPSHSITPLLCAARWPRG